MNLSFLTNMSRQTVQTQIRLLLEEQSDKGVHCLPLHLLILSISEFLDMLNELCGTVQGNLKLLGTRPFCQKSSVFWLISNTDSAFSPISNKMFAYHNILLIIKLSN